MTARRSARAPLLNSNLVGYREQLSGNAWFVMAIQKNIATSEVSKLGARSDGEW
jgi:hypothetical protein